LPGSPINSFVDVVWVFLNFFVVLLKYSLLVSFHDGYLDLLSILDIIEKNVLGCVGNSFVNPLTQVRYFRGLVLLILLMIVNHVLKLFIGQRIGRDEIVDVETCVLLLLGRILFP